MLSRMMGGVHDASTRCLFGKETLSKSKAFYDVIDHDMDGKDVEMSSLKNNVLLFVNVASKWGLTKLNYTQLPLIVDEYGQRGFKVCACPCNQFGGQEPGSHEEILNFADKYGARDKFTWFKKGDVNGSKARDLYSFMKGVLKNEDGTRDVRWNFAKFLIDHEGNPYKRYGAKTSPDDIKKDIDILLEKKRKADESWMKLVY